MADSDFTAKDFYVYVHKRASDGRVFYVGKGSSQRAWSKKNRNQYWHRIVAKHGYTVEIVQDGLQEWYAYELEAETIARIGREFLCNLCDGGIGPSSPSEETRMKMSAKAKLRPPPTLGKPMSEETKKKLSLIKTGKPSKLKGIKLAPELVQKMSESRKGKPNGHTGLKRSKQAKLNMSIAQKNSTNRKDISGENNPSKRLDVRQKMSLSKKGKRTGVENHESKKVICNETSMIFESISIAEGYLKLIGVPGDISQHLRGSSKKAGGFTWRYA